MKKKNCSLFAVLFITAICVLLSQAQAWSAVVKVGPSETYTTIQGAVDAAAAGDEIWVEQGTYTLSETIDIGKKLSLYGGFTGTETDRSQRSSNAALTVVDGNNSVRCFLVYDNITIDGFTITKGDTNSDASNGAGIWNGKSTSNFPSAVLGYLTLSNCIISNNSAGKHSALFNDWGYLTVNDCIFSSNACVNKGGAITNYGHDMTISRCTFTGNSAGNGGAVSFPNTSGSPSATNHNIFNDCVFRQNTALTDAGAIMGDGNVTLNKCVFDRNTSTRYGTIAMRSDTGFSAVLTNCVFTGNTTKFGGALCINGTSGALGVVTAINCTFTGNTLLTGGAGGVIYTSKPSSNGSTVFTITNSILWGNGGSAIVRSGTTQPLPTVSYTDMDQTGYAGTISNSINSNPLFVGSSDYHLQGTSPCKDTGTSSGAPSEDIEGTSRPQGAGYDMGAYERCGTVYYRDADSDTYGDAAITTLACSAPAGYVTNSLDCNDSNSAINPAASDANCDGIDNNCDGSTDEGYVGHSTSCGIGACTATGSTSCVGGSVVDSCSPGTPTIEICDGIDNNCDGSTDEGCVVWYRDADSDTYGDASVTSISITQPSGYVSNSTDCNDGNSAVHPGATEVCNGIDDDCNGLTDDGYVGHSTSCGVGACARTGSTSCVAGSVVDSCTSGTPAAEVCDGIDNNCDGQTDEGLSGVLHVGASWPGTPYATIQAAVDAACDGAEIWVDNETFTLSSTITISKAVSLYGGFTGAETARDQRNPATHVTTVDGNNSVRCFLAKSTVTIDGFTITRGKTDSSNNGAGLSNGLFSSSTPGYLTIANCIFSNNNSGKHAGALFNDVGSVDVSNCTFTSNTAVNKGGAIYTATTPTLSPASRLTITGSNFYSNTAGNGGAVCINANSGTNSMTNSTFSQNKAAPTGSGDGGAVMADANLTITGCVFDQNQAGRNGGVWAGRGDTGTSAVFTNCIFSGNYAQYGSALGINGTTGALGVVKATNCTFTGGTLKTGGKGGAIYTYKPSADGNSIFTLTNSIIWGNAGNAIERSGTTQPLPTVSYTDMDQTGYAGTITNSINSNPLFVGSSDYHLQHYSPCIDTGTSTGAPAADIAGTVRPQGAGYDMGAYEALCTAVYYRDADSDTYGDSAVTTLACSAPAGYVTNSTDCNDSNSAINPAASDANCDGIDNNCNGSTDEGYVGHSTSCGVGACAATGSTSCIGGSVVDSCSPGTPTIEICDGIDNNCDGSTDEGCVVWYRDADSDTYGDASSTTVSVSQPSGYVANSTDCNDANAAVHPGATEVCNGIDDNCNNQIDEGGVCVTTTTSLLVTTTTTSVCIVPVLKAPDGATTARPEFSWTQADSGAWYNLLVWSEARGGIANSMWVGPDNCTGGICKATFGNALAGGNNWWWLNVYYGDPACGFVEMPGGLYKAIQVGGCTALPILTSPTGSVTGKPHFTFTGNGSEWYEILVWSSEGYLVLDQWVDGTACSGDTCSNIISNNNFLPGTTNWWWLNTYSESCGFIMQPGGNWKSFTQN